MGQVLKNFGLAVEHARGHRAARGCWKRALELFASVDDPATRTVRGWIEQPGQEKPSWTAWEIQ
jgi:hypothetical protein